MKILKCTSCGGLVPLREEERACECGAASGRYSSGRKVTYRGPGEIWGVRGIDFYSGPDWRDKMFRIGDDSEWVDRKD